MLRLNIGSGQRKFGTSQAPWINIDSQSKWQPDVCYDGASMPMFHNATADVIVLHHVLEHFGCGEARALLQECRRILIPGGSLLVFVPDMWAIVSAWQDGSITTETFLINVYGAYMGDEADRHKWGFTQQTLRAELQSNGYDAGLFDWRRIDGADIARDWWILGIEGIKRIGC